jgi:Tfp pilus assembly protein PilZ
MLPVEERRTSGGRYDGNERRAGDRRKDPINSRKIGPFGRGTESIGHDVGRGYGGISQVREAGESNRTKEHSPVTFWTLDGNCHAGTTPRMGRGVIFVESSVAVPVGMEITLTLAPVEKPSDAQELAEGTVVWHCPLGDEFENQGGFGVIIRRQWPKGPDSESAVGLKEAI